MNRYFASHFLVCAICLCAYWTLVCILIFFAFPHLAKGFHAEPQIGVEINTLGPTTVHSAVATNPNRDFGGTTALLTLGNSRVIVASDASIVSTMLPNGDAIGIMALDEASVTILPTSNPSQIRVAEFSIGDAFGLVGSNRSFIDFRGKASVIGETNGDAILASLADESTLLLSGTGIVQQDYNGNAVGVDLRGSSIAYLTGVVELTDGGNGDAVFLNGYDDSKAIVTGSAIVRESGNGATVGIRGRQRSHTDFRGDLFLDESGNGDAMVVDLRDHAHVSFNGTILGESNGGIIDGPMFMLRDNSSVDLKGGAIRLAWVSRVPQIQIELRGNSLLTWSGGTIELSTRGDQIVPSINLEDSSTLIVRGSGFSLPIGSVSEPAGVISGLLADGSPFTFKFARENGASIHLVPEPCALLLAIIAAAGIAMSRYITRPRC